MDENAYVNAAQGKTEDISALVLGSGITALGVIRCLGRAGISAWCVSRELGFVAASRWCKRTPQRLTRYAKLGPFLEQLPFERAVLFACSDDWVLQVAELSRQLALRFPSSQATHEMLEVFLDKQQLAETLRRLQVPHPHTVFPVTEDDLTALSDADLARYFLKPCSSQAFSARYHVKAFRAGTRETALARLRQVQADGLEVVLQESVPGPPTNHYFIDGFVDRHGRICARFARRRIRMYPPQFGNSSYMVTIPLGDVAEAVAAVERLIAGTNYRGIFSAEFKFDDRDHTFKLLEMNVRPWWYIELAALCGVDVCAMAYADALGEQVNSVDSYQIGVNLVHPGLDMTIAVKQIFHGELTFSSALNSWIHARQAVFHRDDPLPALVGFAGHVGEWVRDTFSGIGGRKRP